MRIGLVANPAAGAGLRPAEVRAALERRGAEVVELDWGDGSDHRPRAGSRSGGPAGPAAVNAHSRNDRSHSGDPGALDRIVVAGGDGSLGAPAAQAAARDVPLAVVPAGTANDFARALGLPLDPDAAVALAAIGCEERRIDLAHMDDRPWVNAAAAGLSVAAAREARSLKRPLGALAYAAGALCAAIRAAPVTARVTVDGGVLFDGPIWQVIVANTGSFGGGSQVEAADPVDGLLDVAVIEAGARAALAARGWGLRTGAIVRQPGVRHARGAAIELALPGDTGLNVDGELVPGVRRARFGLDPSALRVIVG